MLASNVTLADLQGSWKTTAGGKVPDPGCLEPEGPTLGPACTFASICKERRQTVVGIHRFPFGGGQSRRRVAGDCRGRDTLLGWH